MPSMHMDKQQVHFLPLTFYFFPRQFVDLTCSMCIATLSAFFLSVGATWAQIRIFIHKKAFYYMPLKKKKALHSEQRLYEVIALFPGDVLDKEGEKFSEILQKHLEAVGAEVKRMENWGKRPLTYDIAGHDHAFFVFSHFVLDSEQVIALTKDLRLEPKVLRSLITSVPEEYLLPETAPLAKEFLGWAREPIHPEDAELMKENFDKRAHRRRSGSNMDIKKPEGAPAVDATAPASTAAKKTGAPMSSINQKLDQRLK